MVSLTELLIGLVADTFRGLRLSVRSSRAIKAENLFLRRQLALYVERGVKPRRIDLVTRMGLTVLSRRFNWRDALVVVMLLKPRAVHQVSRSNQSDYCPSLELYARVMGVVERPVQEKKILIEGSYGWHFTSRATILDMLLFPYCAIKSARSA
jgi:hypothetical protein